MVIQRPDKGGGVVIMNKTDYNDKLETLLSDTSKFKICAPEQSNLLKTKLNSITNKYKQQYPQIYKKLHISGEYPPGHLYGLPKVHKSSSDPPLRPIISMSGTVTHDVAAYLNGIIRPYIDEKHIIKSTDEFLACFADTKLKKGQV